MDLQSDKLTDRENVAIRTRRIVKMLMMGYKKVEIIRKLDSSYYEINKKIYEARKDVSKLYR